MKYVLDASVLVASLRVSEPYHADARRHCRPLFAGLDEIVVPAFFDAEVLSALVRRGASASRVERFLKRFVVTKTSITIGPRAVRAANRIIANTKLRAADAFYVWVAEREAIPLVSLDREIVARANAVGVAASLP